VIHNIAIFVPKLKVFLEDKKIVLDEKYFEPVYNLLENSQMCHLEE